MTSETPSKPTKLCPTCGTRVSEDATRCLVCGSDLTPSDKPGKRTKGVQGTRMPEITLSLPAVMGLLSLFLAIGAGLVFFALRQTGKAEPLPTETPTVTITTTATITPTPLPPTATATPLPTPTPISYTVKANETCLDIAYSFGVSVQSLIAENSLGVNCTIFENQILQIPQPTPTATSLPTQTLSAAEATEQACVKEEYTVQESDTLSTIANAYNVPMSVIKEENGLTSDNVPLGMPLTIPLCKRNPTPGPSPTATLPPPYSAPNLLLPRHGANIMEDVVTLQWATVGALTENEAYAVYVLDITDENQPKSVEYVTDTKFIIPESLRPISSEPHIFEWWVVTVRQVGTDDDGNPVWESAGAASTRRAFLWSGLPDGAPAPTATP